MKIANRNSRITVNERTLSEMENYAPPNLYKTTKMKKTEPGRENTMEQEYTLGDTIKLAKKGSQANQARSMSAAATQTRKFSRSSSLSSKEAQDSPKVQKDNAENQNHLNREFGKILPGTQHKDNFLDKGTFDNSHSLISTLLLKNHDLHELAYRKTYNDIEKDYFKSKEASSSEPAGIKIHYGTSSWIQDYLTEPQNQAEFKKKKRLMTISDEINNGHNIMTVNYLPSGESKSALPGFTGKVEVSDRKKAAIIIQKNVRTFLAVRSFKNIKKKLSKFLTNTHDIKESLDAEILDVNWGQFDKTLPKFGKNASNEDTKIMTNTFYSVIRPYVNRDDHGDLLILGELADASNSESEFKTLYKKLYQTEETALQHKFNVMMEKTLKPNYDKDNQSVIKNFLKKNLPTISEKDLKIDQYAKPKFEVKKPKPIQQVAYEKPPIKRDVSPAKNSERQETSEVYEEDFEVDSESNMKNSISENIHGATHDNFASSGKHSIIKESIMMQSVAESRIREDIYESRGSGIKESIRESIEQSSPSRKSGKKYERSIEEDISMSESINMSEEKSRSVRFKKSDAIEEDIEIKEESYGNEKFDSMEESTTLKPALKTSPRGDASTFKTAGILKKETKPEQKPKLQFQKHEEIIPDTNKIDSGRPVAENSKEKHQKPAKFEQSKQKIEVVSSEEDSYGDDYRHEYRKIKMQDIMNDLPPSRTAEILYSNFQKELQKMLYNDTLADKIMTLENTVDKIYTEKEFNILSSLHKKNLAQQRPLPTATTAHHEQVPSQTLQPTDEFNPMFHLLKKQNDLEKAVVNISHQLKTLIDNFTGTGIARPKKAISLNRPVVQTRPRSAAPREQKAQSEITKPIDSKRSLEEEKRENRFEKNDHLKIEPQVQSSAPEKSTSPFKLPFNFKKNDGTPFTVTKKEEPIEVESKTPRLDSKPEIKKADQKKKEDEIEEDILMESSGSNKKFEANFSEKEYSESFEELSNHASPKKLSSRVDELRKSNKSEHSNSNMIDEDIIDEDIQSIKSESDKKPAFQEKKPSFLEKKPLFIAQNLKVPEPEKPINKVEAKKVEPEISKAEQKKPSPAKKDESDDEYSEEIFEELSVHSEPKSDRKPFKVDDVPESQSKMGSPDVEIDSDAMRLKRQATQSSDIEASLDKSNISWQMEFERSGSIDLKEKRTDDILEGVFETLLKELSAPLFPKRNMQEIEKIKARLQQNKKEEEEAAAAAKREQENKKVLADIQVPSSMTSSNLSDFDSTKKHEKYVKTTKKVIEKVATKLSQANKQQIIGLVMHHLNFNPGGKLDMFENSTEDPIVLDSFSEIFTHVFQAEVRALSSQHLTTQDLEKKLSSKLSSIISKTKDVLYKRLNLNGYDLEQYEMIKRVAKDMTSYCEFHRTSDEANDLYEEEEGLLELVLEDAEKIKEEISDEVMEYLFEETVQELNKIKQKRAK